MTRAIRRSIAIYPGQGDQTKEMKRMRRILAVMALAATSLAITVDTFVSSVHAVPTGFSDVTVAGSAANPLASPTAITPMPDGRALILEKGGAVRVLLSSGTLSAADALTLSVCTDSEEGLLGAAIDPNFAANGFVYLFYTRNAGNCASSTGRFNRVSRFTMTNNTISLASELPLLDNMNIPAGNHNGGDLHIGGDGDLYVSVGDGGANPRGTGDTAAEDLSLLNGKILRITLAGGVPADNPFVGQVGAVSCAMAGITTPTSAKCTEIYDYGLRNPFRFAFDPNTGNSQFFINDVGETTWEEVDQGGKGLNYGWNNREGFCNTGSTTACPPTPAGFTDPLTAYPHSIGCNFVTAGVFVPNGAWPPQYDDSYLFADGGCGKMWQRTPSGSVDYASPFALTTGTIVDMAFVTQDGVPTLMYVTNSTSQIHKIVFTRSSSASDLVSLSPARLADTRPGETTVDGLFQGGGQLAGGSTLALTVTGRGGVSADAAAVSLNVTATNSAGFGFVTVFPCGAAQPTSSNLNYTTGTIVPNAVISKVGAGGKVCLFVNVATDLVVDVGGYFPPGTSLASINPARVLDTRPGFPTADGLQQGGGLRGAGSFTELPIAGRLGIPANAAAVVLNVTVTEPAAAGYVTVYPCGGNPPLASNINVVQGSTVANMVVAKIGAGGSVCIFTQSASQLIADVDGYFSGPTTYIPLLPARLLETRDGLTTVDGLSMGVGIRPRGTTTTLQVAGRGGVAVGASTVSMSITVTNPVGAGFVTVYPCGGPVPLASNVNYGAGQTVANATIVKLAPDGTVCLFNSEATDLVADVNGYLI
jgi:glucose/arabinose dehydrogenase